MIVGVPKETFPGERRVALIPQILPTLTKAGVEIIIEQGAGASAGFPDESYSEKGAKIVSRADVLKSADIILQIRAFGPDEFEGLRRGQICIGFFDPLNDPKPIDALAGTGVSAYSMELIPRITRAQSMDALSSMATVAGYKAVLLAATELPRMFPMLMTAAGTIAPARVFIIGVGVAGLQAIATSRRLGAVVQAYDVRPAVREQVESVGARFVELPLEAKGAEDKGGYATAQDESFYRRQRELMARVVAESDVVISTAAIPGKRAPLLITKDAVEGMAPGSVIIDLAAERGGNCELTRADEVVEHNGVRIFGPSNLPSSVPYHASQMYSKNITTFFLHLLKEREKQGGADSEDQILQDTLLTRDGEVVHTRIRELLGFAGAARAEGEA
ncbi:MAG: Re/Si-specific NAD(P)(+) transhydrogenase subunit alpha [Bryobacteraceae bacterium]